MIRTIKIPLHLKPELIQTLKNQALKSTEVFNHVISFGLDNSITNGITIHQQTYYPLRSMIPDMPSQLIISTRMKAVETIKGWLVLKKKRDKQILKQQEVISKGKYIRKPLKPLSKPVAKGLRSIRYDARSFNIDFKTHTISMATIIGRQKIFFNINPYHIQYYTGKVCSADLCWSKSHKHFFFHVVLEFRDPVLPEQPKKVLGVDLGLNNLAVSSDGQFYMKHSIRDRVQRLRGLKSRLQSKDTLSSVRHLKTIRRKEHRFRRDVNHCVTKQIVRLAKIGSYDSIAIEDLKGIWYQNRKKAKLFRARLCSWPFDQFRTFLTDKANSAGIAVSVVNPRYTSQRCSRCGHRDPNQRHGNEFHCVNCGYQNHADLNASYNISKNCLPEVQIKETPGPERQACSSRADVQPAYCNGSAVAMP